MKRWSPRKLFIVLLAAVAVLLAAALVWLTLHKGTHQNNQPGASSQAQADVIAKEDGMTKPLTLLTPQSSSAFNVEIASTDKSRVQGLSGRDGLAPGTGMLFVFPAAGFDCFWMKDMKFDIDMLWFDDNQNLVHVQENASKSTYPNNFCPQTAAQYVLEVPAGTVKQLGLQIGDRFTRP